MHPDGRLRLRQLGKLQVAALAGETISEQKLIAQHTVE
jgi:hypothetical protein